MAGDLTRTGHRRARPQRIRPHWWVVLAVSLSLLALVAAASSNHPGSHENRRPDAAASRSLHAPRFSPTPASTIITTTPPTQPVSALTQTTTTQKVAPVPHGGSIDVATTPATPPTTTTTTTAPPAKGAAIGTAPAQTAPQIWTGDLQQPTDATAKYTFSGAGATQVSVTWSPSTLLSLSVSCPSGPQTIQGSSSAAIVIPDADGYCEVTLQLLLVQYAAVSYTLTIVPASG